MLIAWLRGGLAGRMTALTARSALLDSGLFDAAALRRLAEAHLSGRADHGRALWALLILDAFLRRTAG